MKSLPERIMEHAEAMPEATPICPAALLHLGQRAAVGQALSRLARSGRLMRIRQGVYMRPIKSRFGRCAPGIEKSPQALSELWGETIVPNGGPRGPRSCRPAEIHNTTTRLFWNIIERICTLGYT